MNEAELRTLIEDNWGWALIPAKGGYVVSMPNGTTREFAGLEDLEDFVRTVPVQDAQGNTSYYNPDTNTYEAAPSEPLGLLEKAPRKLPVSPTQYEKIPPEPAEWKTFAPQIAWKDVWRLDRDSGRFVVRPEYQKVFDRFQETYGPLAAPTPQEQLAQTKETRLTAAERARQERQARLDAQTQEVATAQERRLGIQQQLDIARSPGDYLAYFNRLQNQNPTSFTTPTGIPRTFEAGFGGFGGLGMRQGGLPAQEQTGLPPRPEAIQPGTAGDLRSFVQLNPGAQPPGFKTTQQEIAGLQAERDALMREGVPDPFAINRIQERLATLGRLQQTEGGGLVGLGTTNPAIAAELQRRQFAAPNTQGTQFQGTPDIEAEVQKRLARHRQILADNGIQFPNEQLQGLLQFFRQQVQGERGIQSGTTGISAQPTAQGDGGGGLARTLGRESPFPLFRDLYGTRGVSGIPTRQSLQGVTGIPELSRGAFSRLLPSEQELYVGGFELAGVPRQDVFASLNRRPEGPFFRSFR